MASPDVSPADAVRQAVKDALRPEARVLLAVSGGRDSMALLHAVTRTKNSRVAGVATFHHGTGAFADRALDLVRESAAKAGIVCYVGHLGAGARASEAGWRSARWTFLRRSAVTAGATAIATAHTRDDQVETVAIRVLRGAGARGLAGLDVDNDVVRPFLWLSRAVVARYADDAEVKWVEDPSNADRRHLRNRVRHDILPALRAVWTDVDQSLIAIGHCAANWRREVEALVTSIAPIQAGADGFSVACAALAGYDAASLAIMWPVVAAAAGITVDRRGTARLVDFTRTARPGGVIQLSGGVEVRRSRFSFVFERVG